MVGLNSRLVLYLLVFFPGCTAAASNEQTVELLNLTFQCSGEVVETGFAKEKYSYVYAGTQTDFVVDVAIVRFSTNANLRVAIGEEHNIHGRVSGKLNEFGDITAKGNTLAAFAAKAQSPLSALGRFSFIGQVLV